MRDTLLVSGVAVDSIPAVGSRSRARTAAGVVGLACGVVVFLGAGHARGYDVKTTAGGLPLRWGEQTLSIDVSMDGAPESIEGVAGVEAVKSSFAVWSAILPASMPVDIEASPVHTPAEPDAYDQRNAVLWVVSGWDDDYEPNTLAMTLTTYNSETGQIVDADIMINSEQHDWIAGDEALASCQDENDLQNVVTHEVGHLLGLAHEQTEREATMYPSSAPCETKKRDLHEDDVAGIRYLYEALGPIRTEQGPSLFGCSIGGTGHRTRSGQPSRSTDGAVCLMLAAMGVVLGGRGRRFGRTVFFASAVVLAMAALAPVAQATTVRYLSVVDLARNAQVVVRGKVLENHSVRIRGRLYTDSRVTVEDCLKGTCGTEVTVRRLGGELDGEGLVVEGAAALLPGAEVVLFLRARRDGAMAVVGMAQGMMAVDRDIRGRAVRLIRDTRGISVVGPNGAVRMGDVEVLGVETVRAAIVEE
ncbi:MAG: matrixin family metalloprotease [Pseudomonadota bacterium]